MNEGPRRVRRVSPRKGREVPWGQPKRTNTAFDPEVDTDADVGAAPTGSTHHCSFCDTDYGDQEEAIQCCVAVEAIKVIIKNCGTCIEGVCQCGEAGNGGAER